MASLWNVCGDAVVASPGAALPMRLRCEQTQQLPASAPRDWALLALGALALSRLDNLPKVVRRKDLRLHNLNGHRRRRGERPRGGGGGAERREKTTAARRRPGSRASLGGEEAEEESCEEKEKGAREP